MEPLAGKVVRGGLVKDVLNQTMLVLPWFREVLLEEETMAIIQVGGS